MNPYRVCESAYPWNQDVCLDEEINFIESSSSHDSSIQCLESRGEEVALVRTSTPLPMLANGPAPSISNSVNDFFYESWKNDLHKGSQKADQQFIQQQLPEYNQQLSPQYNQQQSPEFIQQQSPEFNQQQLIIQPNCLWIGYQPVQQLHLVTYFSPVVHQLVTTCTFVPQVVYRADGTFGVLVPHWGQ